MSSDVQAVLQEALRAQEYEDDGDLVMALECYYRASCTLTYVLDCTVEKDTALAALCHGLVQSYEQRMTVLRSRQDAKGPQWIQLEQSTQIKATIQPDTSAATSTAADEPLFQHLRLQQCQQQAQVAAAAAGPGGLQQVHDEQFSPAGSSSRLDLLHTCQRVVSGTLDDVLGLEDIKLELEEAVFLPLQHPHLFKGIRQPPRTFLLHGPPGTGKTLLVEKVAAEAGFMLLSISPSMILSKWAGDSEKAISGVFDLARSFQPCIIFLDEVDSLGQSRSNNTDTGARRLLTELLIQFTRAADDDGVYVFGATNRMQDCDPALLRRFSRRIEVPLPDGAAREAFFQSVLSRPELDSALSTEDITLLVQLTDSYSGSDLADLCRTAALAPVRELMHQQRQLLGCKRRRTGLRLLPFCQARRALEEPWASAGSPGDNTPGTDATGLAAMAAACPESNEAMLASGMNTALPTAELVGPTAATAAGAAVADSSQQDTGWAQPLVAQVKLRPMVLSDFQQALAVVKPAAADAGMDAS